MKESAPSDAPTYNILIVEDDRRLATLTQNFLTKNGYSVNVENDGANAPERIIEEQPDLLILDLMLPGQDGLSICRKIRSQFTNPILMLTAQTDDQNQIIGLEVGADDYVTKPIQPQVLLARIRALLRRQPSGEEESEESPTKIKIGPIALDQAKRQAKVEGELVDLTSSEFDLIWLLMSQAGTVLSREDILSQTRGIEYDGLDRSIDVRISKIRKKLGDDTAEVPRIKTVRSKGYLFVK